MFMGRNNRGINPLNGSDARNNPDGDGFDVNHDGILDLNESLVNWPEYHLKDQLIYSDSTDSGLSFPDHFLQLYLLMNLGSDLPPAIPSAPKLVQHIVA